MTVSILMALFNGIEFLCESTGSVEQQTVDTWELLIGVNGHSRSSHIWRQIASFANHRVKIIHCSDEPGKSRALNYLIERAQGDAICTLDADDRWEPHKLNEQLRFWSAYDVIGTGCQYFGDRCDGPGICLGEVPRHSLLSTNHIVNSSAMMHRRDAHWDPEWEGIEDYDLWLRLAAAGRSFFNVPAILCLHRIHADSAFRNTPTQQLDALRRRWSGKIV